MKLKTHKTVSKRVHVTKTGKLLKRKGGQDHFNSRERGNTSRNKRRDLEVNKVYSANMKTLMPYA
jgi:ribosomal protein L35